MYSNNRDRKLTVMLNKSKWLTYAVNLHHMQCVMLENYCSIQCCSKPLSTHSTYTQHSTIGSTKMFLVYLYHLILCEVQLVGNALNSKDSHEARVY